MLILVSSPTFDANRLLLAGNKIPTKNILSVYPDILNSVTSAGMTLMAIYPEFKQSNLLEGYLSGLTLHTSKNILSPVRYRGAGSLLLLELYWHLTC